MLRAALVGGDERKVDVGLHRRGKLDLGFLRGFLQALHRHPVLAEIDAVGLLELRDHPVDDALIQIVTAKMRVAVGRLHLDDAFAHLEDRNVERAAAEVVHRDGFVLFLVEAVRQGGCGRLVDDAQDVQPRDLAGVLGRLSLRVVEVRRNGDDGIGHRLAQVVFGGLLQLLEHHRRDFRRRVFPVTSHDPGVAVVGAHDAVRDAGRLARHLVVLSPHESLDREDRVLGVADRLALGDLADEPLAVASETDH